jgi:DNA-binding transcriptional LysR family regulator
MKIEDLRSFMALIGHGSLTGAAAHLRVTQPAVTRRIQRLEKTLGGSLLDRSVKPARLSALGTRVYERAHAVLRDLDALREIMEVDAEPQGTLRIGATGSISDLSTVPIVTGLKQRFPKLRIEIQPGIGAELLAKVRSGRLDAAAIMLPSSSGLPEGTLGDFVGIQRTAIVAPKTFPLKGRIAFRQLAPYPWVVYPEAGCIYRAALEREHAARELGLQVAVSEYSAERQLALVAAGAGLGMVSQMMLGASRHRDKLRVLRIADFEFDFGIWVIRPPFLGRLTAPVKLVTDVVMTCCGPVRKNA